MEIKLEILTIEKPLPAGYVARPGKLGDYLLALDLENVYGYQLNGRNNLADPELARLNWENEGFNPETDIRTVYAPDGMLVGFAECWLNSKPPVHPWKWVCVHPDHMNKGIWEYRLTWGENRSRAALDQVEPGLRVAPRTGTEHHNHGGIQTIKDLDWTHIRSYYRMETRPGFGAEKSSSCPRGFTSAPSTRRRRGDPRTRPSRPARPGAP